MPLKGTATFISVVVTVSWGTRVHLLLEHPLTAWRGVACSLHLVPPRPTAAPALQWSASSRDSALQRVTFSPTPSKLTEGVAKTNIWSLHLVSHPQFWAQWSIHLFLRGLRSPYRLTSEASHHLPWWLVGESRPALPFSLGSIPGTLEHTGKVHSTRLLSATSLDFFLPSISLGFLLTLPEPFRSLQVSSFPTIRRVTAEFLPAASFCAKLLLLITFSQSPAGSHH